MTRLRATDPIRVDLGECECPEKPHDMDVAWLRPRLLVGDAMAALSVLREGGTTADLNRDIGNIFIETGLVDWTLLDDKSVKIPLSAALDGGIDWETMRPISDKAAELYTGPLLDPLVRALPASSPRGRTGASTSRKRRSRP